MLDPNLVSAVQGFEGFAPKASWDYRQYTNGYGTRASGPGEQIDQPTAMARLTDELGKAQGQVDAMGVQNMPGGVRNALTSLTFNTGNDWMKAGLGDAVRAGDWDKARDIFLTYNKAGGEPNAGLTARRQAEASWWGGQPNPASVSQPAPFQAIPAATAPSTPLFAAGGPAAAPGESPPASSFFGSLPADAGQQMSMQSLPMFRRPAPDLSQLQAFLASQGRV